MGGGGEGRGYRLVGVARPSVLKWHSFISEVLTSLIAV